MDKHLFIHAIRESIVLIAHQFHLGVVVITAYFH